MAITAQAPISHRTETGVTRSTPSADTPRTGAWVGMAAITMTFAAFTSAMLVRQGSADDWRHFSLPPVLYFNTCMILASSVILQAARRRFNATTTEPRDRKFVSRALLATLLLGMVFVIGQCVAWVQLRAEGLFVATSPSSSFFYVFTALHALHVLGGLAGLAYVSRKLRRGLLGTTLDAASYYWHFMAALWLYLFVVLRLEI